MKEPQWVLRETVTALQERLLAEFGGLAGVRDEALLESAINRPRHRFLYDKVSVFELAASYAVRTLTIRHCMVTNHNLA